MVGSGAPPNKPGVLPIVNVKRNLIVREPTTPVGGVLESD